MPLLVAFLIFVAVYLSITIGGYLIIVAFAVLRAALYGIFVVIRDLVNFVAGRRKVQEIHEEYVIEEEEFSAPTPTTIELPRSSWRRIS